MSGLDHANTNRGDEAHVEWDELAVGWALRALEPDDEDRFTVHLPGCERCQASVSDGSRIITALVEQLPLQSPSPELRTRLLAEIGKTRPIAAAPPAAPAQPATGPRPESALGESVIDLAAARHRSGARQSRSTWTRISTLVAAAAAVLVIAGLGVWNVNLQTDRDHFSTVAADRGAILQDLAAAGEVSMTPLRDGDGQAVATLVTGVSQTMVMTNGLPVNDSSDEIYVLWGLQAAGEQPQALGTFDVVGAELDMRTVSSTAAGIDSFDGYAVTLESGRAAPEGPTLPMVASGQVTA